MSSARLLHVLLVAACAAAALAVNLADVPCGKTTAATRIVGGRTARRGQYPWLVSIQTGGQHWCGGTLVNKWFVVTAAHCLKRKPASQFQVVVGEHDLSKGDDGAVSIAVKAIALYPSYKVGKFRHDLAVMRLTTAASWGERVQPACLPEQTQKPVNRTGTVAGWGWTDEVSKGGERADLLQAVDAPVMGPAQCTAWFADAGKRNKLREGQLCAGFKEGGKDGCQGDSGGPLILSEAGRATLTGVVSAGIGCGRPSLPGVYTHVAKYMDWIEKMVK